MTRFIAVVSGKGGVGKTTVAVNLGTALVNSGVDTIVVDGNLTTPHIGTYLGFPHPSVSLHEVIKGKALLENATYLHASGLKVIPGSIRLDALDGLNLSRIKKTFSKLKGYSETVLIDTGAGLTHESQAVMSVADEIIIVTNPDFAAVTDALKTIKKAENQNKLLLGVILNKISSIHNEISTENVASILRLPIIGEIPKDESIRHSWVLKQPVVYTEPNSEVTAEFKRIAERLK